MSGVVNIMVLNVAVKTRYRTRTVGTFAFIGDVIENLTGIQRLKDLHPHGILIR